MANVSERNADGQLLEVFWQGLARLRPPKPKPGVLPLVGVPILNGLDHLRRLLASLDVPIDTLAMPDGEPIAEAPAAPPDATVALTAASGGSPGA